MLPFHKVPIKFNPPCFTSFSKYSIDFSGFNTYCFHKRLIDSGVVPVIRLTRIFRQAQTILAGSGVRSVRVNDVEQNFTFSNEEGDGSDAW